MPISVRIGYSSVLTITLIISPLNPICLSLSANVLLENICFEEIMQPLHSDLVLDYEEMGKFL